jgi:capsular polysaccharide biosynthesis protein
MIEDPNRTGDGRTEAASYFAAIREHRLLAALVVLVAFGAAFAASKLSKEHYEGETVVLVTPVTDDNAQLTGLGLLKDPAGSVFTAASLVDTPQILGETIRRLKLNETQRALLASIKITPLPQGNSFSILAKQDNPQDAAKLANTLADSVIGERTNAFQTKLRTTIERLQRQRADLRGTDALVAGRDIESRIGYLRGFLGDKDPTLEVLTRAEEPELPATRSHLLVFVAFFAALLLGTGVAILLELISPRLRGEYDLPSRVPLLARIPYVPARTARRFFSGRGALPPGAFEPYRMLRARLTAPGPAGELPRSVLVTSAISGETRTRTAAGLATAIAASGRSVVLVDADLRGSRLPALFGLQPTGPGFAAMIEGDPIDLDEALLPAGKRWPNLRILPAGTDSVRGLDLLDPVRVEAALADLPREVDVFVNDAGPITV